MNITINGRIVVALSPKRGVSQISGKEWVSQDFVIQEEDGTRVQFSVFGTASLQKYALEVGAVASVTCKLEVKEWQGKYFNQVQCTNCITQARNTKPKNDEPKETRPIKRVRQQDSTDIDELPF